MIFQVNGGLLSELELDGARGRCLNIDFKGTYIFCIVKSTYLKEIIELAKN